MKPLTSLSLPLLLMTLGACAAAPYGNPQQDAEAKRFDVPPSGGGALYIYRKGWFGFVRPVDVGIASGVRTQLPNDAYLKLDGPPGQIEVNCRVGDKSDQRQVEVVAGEARYLEVSMTPGLLGPGCEIAEVALDQGQAAVRATKRVMAPGQL